MGKKLPVFSADAQQRISAAVRKVEGTSRPVNARPSATQTGVIRSFQAILTDEGPDGEDDYDDARYWFKRGYASNAADAQIVVTAYGEDDPLFLHAAATNLAEAVNDSHSLPAGTPVMIFYAWNGNGDTPAVDYWFTSAGSIPAPYQKYQTFQPRDDTLVPTWGPLQIGP